MAGSEQSSSGAPAAPDFSEALEELSGAMWAHAALTAALEMGMLDRLCSPVREADLLAACRVEPGLGSTLVENLLALGAIRRAPGEPGLLEPTPALEMLVGPGAGRMTAAGIRSDQLQTREVFDRVREGRDPAGWAPDDPATLTAQGDTGREMGAILEALLPALGGLEARIRRPGAWILDVGAGVGAVAAEFCRVAPGSRVVGLEPNTMARDLGRSRIAAAGLGDRITLRNQLLEDLDEVDRYDLAFLPQPFLGDAAIEVGLPRVVRALRPGGWLIALLQDLPPDRPRVAAARRFRARIWGGSDRSPGEMRALLEEAGLEPGAGEHPFGSYRAVCARRTAGRIIPACTSRSIASPSRPTSNA